MELSNRIKELRNEKGWSQEVLAERAYVSRQTISNWETEKSYPDVHSLLILSDLFGVSLDELIKGDVDTMKEKVNEKDVNALKRLPYYALAGMAVLILVVPFLVEQCGEIGRAAGLLIAGAASVLIFAAFHKQEQIKKDNDIQTYREVIAFINGETLDDLEKEREIKKRRTQKAVMVAVACICIAELAAAAVALVMELIRI